MGFIEWAAAFNDARLDPQVSVGKLHHGSSRTRKKLANRGLPLGVISR